ncbi:MAG: CRISPR-associated protein Cas4 [Candidatus Saccharicenans sp.]
MRLELTVNDIKQYYYCKRIVFFNYVIPVDKKPTYKMEHGRLMEEEIKQLENRRILKKYNIYEGERLFNLNMISEKMGLSGKLDMLIISPKGYFPVDFKFTSAFPHKNHLYQMCGYALLLEEKFHKDVTTGFIYLIPKKDIVVFNLTENLKNDTINKLNEIRLMILSEKMPQPADSRRKCYDCEFRNYCGDIF